MLCNKLYPYINNDKVTLSLREKKSIFYDCYALSIYRINSIVLNATDNIVLSSYVGLGIVALYSNYLLITKSLRKIIDVIFNSLTASVGNLYEDKKDDSSTYDVFMQINYISFFINGIVATGIAMVINPFIEMWIGNKFLLSDFFVILIVLDFYIVGMQRTRSVFRSGMGLFQQAKYRPLAGAVINVLLSIMLVKKFSIEGVIAATVFSSVATYSWFDPLVIMRDGFGRKPWQYYRINIMYFTVFMVTCLLCKILCDRVPFFGFMKLFFCVGISILLPSLIYILVFYRSKSVKGLKIRLEFIFNKIKGK